MGGGVKVVLTSPSPPRGAREDARRGSVRFSDEDITSMDMTILVHSYPKVNQLQIKIKFGTIEQLMLHYDFCAFSFSEILDWIKLCVWKLHGKHGGPKKLIGNQAQVLPMFSTRPPHHFWCKKRKSPNPTRFGCRIRTAG
jgi:hypothetical protein